MREPDGLTYAARWGGGYGAVFVPKGAAQVEVRLEEPAKIDAKAQGSRIRPLLVEGRTTDVSIPAEGGEEGTVRHGPRTASAH